MLPHEIEKADDQTGALPIRSGAILARTHEGRRRLVRVRFGRVVVDHTILGLTVIVGFFNLACFFGTLIRLFTKEGAGLGILGLLLGIYTFWWGWKHIDRPGDRIVMTAWSVGLAISIILNFAARATVG